MGYIKLRDYLLNHNFNSKDEYDNTLSRFLKELKLSDAEEEILLNVIMKRVNSCILQPKSAVQAKM